MSEIVCIVHSLFSNNFATISNRRTKTYLFLLVYISDLRKGDRGNYTNCENITMKMVLCSHLSLYLYLFESETEKVEMAVYFQLIHSRHFPYTHMSTFSICMYTLLSGLVYIYPYQLHVVSYIE